MTKKSLVCLFASVGTIFLLTGCGTKKINVFDTMDVEFTGANGYGKANITGAYDFEDKIFSKSESLAGLETVLGLENCIDITIDQENNLSNGDKVKVTVEADNKKAKKLGYNFKTGSKTYKVSGLEDAEIVDLFENCVVTFDGISPYVNASVKSSVEPKSGQSVYYQIENKNNLKLGDTVVVTVTLPNEESLLQNGYIAKSFTKEYTVENLPFYPSNIAEIPENVMTAMKKQAEDVCRANNTSSLSDEEKFLDCEYIGAYYLTAKPNTYNAKNGINLIYKVTIENTDGIIDFYWWCRFTDIIVMEDGMGSVDLSSYDVPRQGFMSSDYVTIGNFRYAGFADKETMFNKLVTSYIDRYNYENAVTE